MKIDECGVEVAEWLEAKLLSSLRATNSQAQNSNVILAVKDSEDRIVGGLVASTSYGWLLVKILWIDERNRRSGIGRALMEHAELSASSLGCHGAWLDTSSPQAYKFYLELGFETFGQLHNQIDQDPPGHQRWFMKKSLQSEFE